MEYNIISLFIITILFYKWEIIPKNICKPCLSFWITLPIAFFNLETPFLIFILVFLYEIYKPI